MMLWNETRVLVLKSGTDLLREIPLAQACAETGMPLARTLEALPLLAAGLRSQGAAAVLASAPVQGRADPCLWLEGEHARGWVRLAGHLGGQLAGHLEWPALVQAWQARLADGFVPVDAALLAWPALPQMSWGPALPPDAPPRTGQGTVAAGRPAYGIYAIVDTLAQLRRVLDAGVRTVQLRIKRPADADTAWHSGLRDTLVEGLRMVRDQGALLYINDHWQLAAELGADAVHLGQEDLLMLGESGRAALAATGVALGISSHAAWELCRARSLSPAYVACGPVWPTTTKDMPWRPQGLDNLAWWCQTAGVPVVAIGGILTAEQVRQTAAAGAASVCVLRGLGDDPARTVPALQAAFEQGRQQAPSGAAASAGRQPHPSLEWRA